MAKKGYPFKWESVRQEAQQMVLEKIAEGYTIEGFKNDPDMPSRNTLYRWLHEDEKFADDVRIARTAYADKRASESFEYADRLRDKAVSGDKIESSHVALGGLLVNNATIAKSGFGLGRYVDREDKTGVDAVIKALRGMAKPDAE